jgi:hypothetical protein
MSATNLLNPVLWSVQGLLALFFLAVGAAKVFSRGLERWAGFAELPQPLVVSIGIAEVLGAAGLVLPMVTGTLPWMTPLAALGLAIIVLMATGFHLRADERPQALETALWAGVAAVVAIGRWDLLATRADVSPSMLVAALSLLVPSLIINVIVLLKRPASRGAGDPSSAGARHAAHAP